MEKALFLRGLLRLRFGVRVEVKVSVNGKVNRKLKVN